MCRVSWGWGGSKSADEVSRAAVLGGAGRDGAGVQRGQWPGGCFNLKGGSMVGGAHLQWLREACREVEVALRSFPGFVHL